MFFNYQEGSLVNHQAYNPYTLVGPPALRLVLDPLAAIFLIAQIQRRYSSHF